MQSPQQSSPLSSSLQVAPSGLVQQTLAPFAPASYGPSPTPQAVAGVSMNNAQSSASLLRLARLIAQLDRSVPLPSTAQGFFLYSLGLLFLVLVGVSHVYLSAQILQAEVQLRELKNVHGLIEQQNSELVWQIARETDLARLQSKLVALGYVPASDIRYVMVPARGTQESLLALETAAPTGEQSETTAGKRSERGIDLWGQLMAYLNAGVRQPEENVPAFAQEPANRPVVQVGAGEKPQPHEWWRNWWHQVWQQSSSTLQRLNLR